MCLHTLNASPGDGPTLSFCGLQFTLERNTRLGEKSINQSSLSTRHFSHTFSVLISIAVCGGPLYYSLLWRSKTRLGEASHFCGLHSLSAKVEFEPRLDGLQTLFLFAPPLLVEDLDSSFGPSSD